MAQSLVAVKIRPEVREGFRQLAVQLTARAGRVLSLGDIAAALLTVGRDNLDAVVTALTASPELANAEGDTQS